MAAAKLSGPSRARHLSAARGLACLLARETGAAPLRALATRFGRDPSSLGRVLGHLEAGAKPDPALAERIGRLNNTIIHA